MDIPEARTPLYFLSNFPIKSALYIFYDFFTSIYMSFGTESFNYDLFSQGNMLINVKKLTPNAKLPTYAHPGDAGMDMYASEECAITPGQIVAVPTGMAFEIPHGYVGLIWDKSGLALKNGLKMMGGVIDSGYRGETKVVVINLGKETYTVGKHTKIAQMLIQPIVSGEIVEVSDLSDSSRATGGFGSSGLH